MADPVTAAPVATKTRRRPTGPKVMRPLHIVYRAALNAEGQPDIQIIAIERDTNKVLEAMEANPGCKRLKFQLKPEVAAAVAQ